MRAAFALRSAVAKAVASVSNVLPNGTFTTSAGWEGSIGYNGKTISGGKANFAASTAYDGFTTTPVTLTAGKYYELTWTISSRTSGQVYPYLSGGTVRNGTSRNANGTYTERLLANTGNNGFGFQLDTGPGTLSVDDITLVGPYNTSTVGGA